MHSKELVVILLALVSCITIVRARYDSNEDSVESSNEEPLHGTVLRGKSVNQQKSSNKFMKHLRLLRMHYDEPSSQESKEAQRGWSHFKPSDTDLQPSLRQSSLRNDANSQDNNGCGRQIFQPTFSASNVGGYEAVPHSWPWQVLYEGSINCEPSATGGNCVHACEGTLINENYVLTSAFCIRTGGQDSRKIIAGIYDRRSSQELKERWQIRDVAEIFIYPNWSSLTFKDDIALLRLAEPVKFNEYVQPVCLPGPDPLPISEATLIGWGREPTNGVIPLVLQQRVVDVIDDCNAKRPEVDDAKQLCFKDPTLTPAICRGDSGGPALRQYNGRWVVEGITSIYSVMCSSANRNTFYPYTRVSAYLNWIHNITGH